MPVGLSFMELMEYTDWGRGVWQLWMRKQGDSVLAIKAGENGDGRFDTIGDVIRHIFSAEKRYIDRLSNRPLTDTGAIPSDKIEPVFQFGQQSRKELREFVKSRTDQEWDAPFEFKMFQLLVKATPRKIVAHILMHEIRHWVQIATLLRLNGMKGEFHDFLFSPVLGGGIERLAD